MLGYFKTLIIHFSLSTSWTILNHLAEYLSTSVPSEKRCHYMDLLSYRTFHCKCTKNKNSQFKWEGRFIPIINGKRAKLHDSKLPYHIDSCRFAKPFMRKHKFTLSNPKWLIESASAHRFTYKILQIHPFHHFCTSQPRRYPPDQHYTALPHACSFWW